MSQISIFPFGRIDVTGRRHSRLLVQWKFFYSACMAGAGRALWIHGLEHILPLILALYNSYMPAIGHPGGHGMRLQIMWALVWYLSGLLKKQPMSTTRLSLLVFRCKDFILIKTTGTSIPGSCNLGASAVVIWGKVNQITYDNPGPLYSL